MRKRALSYLLCATMAFGMAACGNKPDDGKQQEENKQDENKKDEEGKPDENNKDEEGKPDENKKDEDDKPDENKKDEDDKQDENKPDEEGKQEEENPPEEDVVQEGPLALRFEAETYVQGEGVSTENDHLGGLNTSAWAMYNVDLKDGGYKQVSVRYGADSIGGTVRLWIGDEDYKEFGTLVGEAVFEGTGSWDMNGMVTFDVPDLSNQSGPTDLVVEWESPEGESDYLMNPDYFELYKLTKAGAKTNTWQFVENDFSGNEWAGFRGDEPNYTHIYVSGGCYTSYKLDFGEGGYKELALTGDFVGECGLELHLDAPDGQLVGSYSFTGAADWTNNLRNTYTLNVPEMAEVTGFHGLYLVFTGGDYNFASFRFYDKPALKLSERIEAEDNIEGTASHDVNDANSGGGNIGGTQGNVYAVYRFDFEEGGYQKVLMKFGTITPGGNVEVRYDDPEGELITTIAMNAEDAPDGKPDNFGKDWNAFADYEIDVPELAGLTGEQIICFVFQPTIGPNDWVGNFDYYEFSK